MCTSLKESYLQVKSGKKQLFWVGLGMNIL